MPGEGRRPRRDPGRSCLGRARAVGGRALGIESGKAEAKRESAAGLAALVVERLQLLPLPEVGRNVTALTGYNQSSAGRVIHESGPSRDVDFGYLSLAYAF